MVSMFSDSSRSILIMSAKEWAYSDVFELKKRDLNWDKEGIVDLE